MATAIASFRMASFAITLMRYYAFSEYYAISRRIELPLTLSTIFSLIEAAFIHFRHSFLSLRFSFIELPATDTGLRH